MKKSKIKFFILFFIICFIANGMENEKIQAKLYMINEEYDKAIEMLKSIEIKGEKQDIEIFFILGESFYNKKNYNEAIKYYNKVLTLNEKANKARIMLIKSYKNINNEKKANEEYKKLKEYISDEDILQELKKIEINEKKVKVKNYGIYLDAGYIYNDNVNSGIDKDSIKGVEVSEKYKKKADSGVKADFGIHYKKDFKNGYALKPVLNIETENYLKYSEESYYKINTILDISKYGKNYYLAIPFVLTNVYTGEEREDFYYGINVKYKHILKKNMIFSKNIELYEKKNYISKYNGEVLAADMYIDAFRINNNYIRCGLKYSDEFYNLKYFASSRIGAKIEYSKEFDKDIIFKIGYESDLFKKYKEKEEGLDEKREDKKSEIKLIFMKNFRNQDININMDLRYIKNESNFEIYDYDNFKFIFSAIKSF